MGRVSGKSRTVAPPSGETVPAAPAAPAPLPAYRVLLVDDDPLQLEMVAAMCRRAGLVAECCQYPEYAGRLVAENRFDAVVTDIQMPSCDGFRVLEEVHRAAPGLPVVAVSARGDLGAGEFAARGFAACLRKPFTYGELVEALRTAAGAVADADAEAALAPETPAAEETGAATGGWNLAALTAFAGDDHEAARSILDSFVEQTTANREALCAALDAGDDAAAKAQAHKMLPLLTMLGDDGVATVLRQAETAPGAFDAPLREELRRAAARIAEGVACAAAACRGENMPGGEPRTE